MRCSVELSPDVVREVATILARGFLNHRRSLAIPFLTSPEKGLDTGVAPSAHVLAVNNAREGEE